MLKMMARNPSSSPNVSGVQLKNLDLLVSFPSALSFEISVAYLHIQSMDGVASTALTHKWCVCVVCVLHACGAFVSGPHARTTCTYHTHTPHIHTTYTTYTHPTQRHVSHTRTTHMLHKTHTHVIPTGPPYHCALRSVIWLGIALLCTLKTVKAWVSQTQVHMMQLFSSHCYAALHLFKEMKLQIRNHIIVVCIYILFGHAHYFLQTNIAN